MIPVATDQFLRRADYLDACHESWKSVFDSYDKLLRSLVSLCNEPSDEVLCLIEKTRKEINEKKVELDNLFDKTLEQIRAGFPIELTLPMAFKCDNLNLARVLRQAWHQNQSTKTSPSVPFGHRLSSSQNGTQSRSSPPPIDFLYSPLHSSISSVYNNGHNYQLDLTRPTSLGAISRPHSTVTTTITTVQTNSLNRTPAVCTNAMNSGYLDPFTFSFGSILQRTMDDPIERTTMEKRPSNETVDHSEESWGSEDLNDFEKVNFGNESIADGNNTNLKHSSFPVGNNGNGRQFFLLEVIRIIFDALRLLF